MDETLNQKVISFATSDGYQGAVELLRRNRTHITSILSDSEFQTLVNALTIEIESNLIQRLVVSIDSIRNGEPPPAA
jgi:hypothetical protein